MTTKVKTIRKSDLEEIAELLNVYDESAVRTNYSARGMAETTCVGIVTSEPLKVGYAIAAVFGVDNGVLESDHDFERAETGEKLVESATTDRMGYDTIVYFPGWTLDDG